MQPNSSGAEFLSTISKFIKRNIILSLLAYVLHKTWNYIGIFTRYSCSDGKEMYKKAWCTCKVVFLPYQAIPFFTFSSPQHLTLDIIYDTLWSVRNRIFSVQIESLLLIASETFFDSSVVPSFLVWKLGERTEQLWRDNSCRVWTYEKNSGETVVPIGHNNTKHFLSPIRSHHSLDRLEMVRWESVPRGFSACAWKLSSRLFSRPDWLPLGLRGWDFLKPW